MLYFILRRVQYTDACFSFNGNRMTQIEDFIWLELIQIPLPPAPWPVAAQFKINLKWRD